MPGNSPYEKIKYAIRGSESSHRFFVNGRLIKNKDSSAKGPYQIVDKTWNDVNNIARQRYQRNLNLNNPNDHELAMDLLMEKYVDSLKSNGLPINGTTLYMMHFKGDVNWVKKSLANPNLPTSAVFSQKEINSNPTILGGKTVGQTIQILNNKIQKNLPNKSNYTMPTISDYKNPNFDKAQSLSKSQKDKINLEYRTKIRSFKGDQAKIDAYHKELYEKGYMGFDSNGKPIGFIADDVNRQMKANLDKHNKIVSAKKTALRTLGEIIRENTEHESNSYYSNQGSRVSWASDATPKSVVKLDVNERKVKEAVANAVKKINTLGLPDDEAVKIISQLKKVEAKMIKKDDSVLLDIQKDYNSLAGRKDVNMFVKNKDGSIGTGSDIAFQDGKFIFAQNKKNLNVETPVVYGQFKPDLVLPNGNPDLDGTAPDQVDGVDQTMDVTEMSGYGGYGGYDSQLGSNLNYFNYNPADVEKARQEGELKKKELELKYAEKQFLANEEAKKKIEEQNQKDKEQDEINTARTKLDFEDITPQGMGSADPSTFKSHLPWDKIVQGAIGVALGKDMMEEELPMRDERINNAFLSYIHEQKRISDLGMNPSDEAAAKQHLADAYQMGIENLTRNASGNRALILGNSANLDNINAHALMQLSVEDAKMKEKAFAEYGKAMEYVNSFEQTRQIANNERKYQQALQKQAAGASVMAGAFKSMTDALDSYNSPTSAENMFKIQNHVDMWGWSPLVNDDGNGTNWGSKSWYDKNRQDSENRKLDRNFLKGKFNSESKEFQNDFLKKNKDLSRNEMFSELEKIYGKREETKPTTITTIGEDNNIIKQEQQPSQATVPTNITVMQKADGTTQPITPFVQKITEENALNNTQNSQNVIQTKGTTPDGQKVEIKQTENAVKPPFKAEPSSKDKGINMVTGQPIGSNVNKNDDFVKSIFASMGLQDTYAEAEDINSFINTFDDGKNNGLKNIENIISKYNA